MWWGRSEVVDVYLSGSTFAVRQGTAAPEVQAIGDDDWQSPLQAALTAQPGRRWRAWLGGRQCSLHRVEPIAGVRSIEEAEAALSALLSTGSAPVNARLATWSPPSDGAWVAACVPAALPGALQALVAAHGGRLAGLQPWWAARPQAVADNAAMCDDEVISYWRSDGRGRVSAAASLAIPVDARAPTLARLRVGGPLDAWRLSFDAPMQKAQPGFAIVQLTERADAAASAAV